MEYTPNKASDFRAMARDRLAGRWPVTIGATLLAGILGGHVLLYEGGNVLSILVNTGQNFNNTQYGMEYDSRMIPIFMFFLGIASMASIVGLVQFIVGPFISFGLIQFNLDLFDRKDPEVGVVFSKGQFLGKALWLKIRGKIFIFLWSLLFVIPGIIKSFSYSMAGYIMVENPEITAKEAMTISMDMMRGNKFRLFCLSFSFFGWALLACLTLGIGFIWLTPYMNASYTAFYNEISSIYQRYYS